MALTKDERRVLDETNANGKELKTCLLGAGGADTGLVGEVKNIKLNHQALERKHYKLSKTFWIVVGILVGSGVISAGASGLFP